MRVWEDVGLRPLQINYKALIFFFSYIILSTSQLMSHDRKWFETEREREREKEQRTCLWLILSPRRKDIIFMYQDGESPHRRYSGNTAFQGGSKEKWMVPSSQPVTLPVSVLGNSLSSNPSPNTILIRHITIATFRGRIPLPHGKLIELYNLFCSWGM